MGAPEHSSLSPDPSPGHNSVPELENGGQQPTGHHPDYVASLDLGTTTLRCLVYDRQAQVVGKAQEKVTLLYPTPERVEMDPEELWEKFIKVINAAIANGGLSPHDIRCLGISTQRATFTMWDRRTGRTLHNLITWKDVRADSLVKQWNNCVTLRTIRFVSKLLYKVLRQKRFLAGSVLKLMNIQVNMRLKWVLENVEEAAQLTREGQALFGTIDTWLMYRLSQGKIHATDYSNASGTALYDPFIEDWNAFLLRIFGIPLSILPELRPSVGDWGVCPTKLFGAPIPITTVVSDQGAALFGSCGFQRGDVKITLGTGAFMDVNTGSKPHASVKGIYPVHGWKDSEGLVHMAEASSNDNGTVIEWGQQIGLYDKPSDTSEMASSVDGPSSVFFIPAFQGIQAPLNDATATAGFLGLSADTGKPQMVRAMLEALAFRVHQMYTAMRTEAEHDLLSISTTRPIRVDGGVAQNNFLLQTIATLIGRPVERPKSIDVSALGTAFLAGLGAGMWKSREELVPLVEMDRVFQPEMSEQAALLHKMKEWERALERFTHWHPEDRNTLGQSHSHAHTHDSHPDAHTHHSHSDAHTHDSHTKNGLPQGLGDQSKTCEQGDSWYKSRKSELHMLNSEGDVSSLNNLVLIIISVIILLVSYTLYA